MKLFQIEYLLAACTHGSISKAADQMLLSRPAVSRALRELEEEYGVNLLRRTSTGISLTEAGLEFHDSCVKIMDQLNKLETRMATIRENNVKNKQRALRLGLSAAAGNYLIKKYYDRFISEYPDIALEFCELLDGQAAAMLRKNTIDLAIAAYFGPEDTDMESIIVSQMEMVFCCSKNHRLAGRKSIDIPDLDGEPLAQLDRVLLKGNAIPELFAKYNLKPNTKIHVRQISMLWNLIKNGSFGAVTFRQMMEDSDEMVGIPFTEPVTYPMQIMWNRDSAQNSAFRDFFFFLDTILKEKGNPAIPCPGPADL